MCSCFIVHVCSCLIEFIKRVEKQRYNARLAEHFLFFKTRFIKFNNTGVRVVDSFYHMTLIFAMIALVLPYFAKT